MGLTPWRRPRVEAVTVLFGTAHCASPRPASPAATQTACLALRCPHITHGSPLAALAQHRTFGSGSCCLVPCALGRTAAEATHNRVPAREQRSHRLLPSCDAVGCGNQPAPAAERQRTRLQRKTKHAHLMRNIRTRKHCANFRSHRTRNSSENARNAFTRLYSHAPAPICFAAAASTRYPAPPVLPRRRCSQSWQP